MAIDKESLEVLNLIHYGVPDKIIEEHAEKINEIYEVLGKLAEETEQDKYFIEIKPNSEAFRGHNIGWYTYANSIEEATPENPFVLPAQGDYDYDVTVVTVENTNGEEVINNE